MRPHFTKQAEAKLKERDYVLPRHRPNLLRTLYQGHYLGYARVMDNYINIDHRVVSFSQYFGIYLGNGRYYPYFLLDKKETYNIEEDI